MSTSGVRKYQALRTAQIALNAVTATAVYAVGIRGDSGDTGVDDFRVVKNIDSAITIYLGPATVSAANGFPLAPGESFVLAGPSGLSIQSPVYAIAATGTPDCATFTV